VKVIQDAFKLQQHVQSVAVFLDSADGSSNFVDVDHAGILFLSSIYALSKRTLIRAIS
jgi:hypothetical protein